MGHLRVCAFCGNTGKNGANFVLCVGSDENRVHKYCGEKLREQAPPEATVRLLHWAELAREKREAKVLQEKERVSDFWSGKFAKAAARKAAAPQAA